MEITRDFENELLEAGNEGKRRMVAHAVAARIITRDGGEALLRELEAKSQKEGGSI